MLKLSDKDFFLRYHKDALTSNYEYAWNEWKNVSIKYRKFQQKDKYIMKTWVEILEWTWELSCLV